MRAVNRDIFACLQVDYTNNLYFFERRLHSSKRQYFRCMMHLKALLPIATAVQQKRFYQLEKFFEWLLSCASLRWRVSDATIFSLCQLELKALSQAIDQLLVQFLKPRNTSLNDIATETLAHPLHLFERLFHNIICVTAREPLAFLLFINSLNNLHAFIDAPSSVANVQPLIQSPKPPSLVLQKIFVTVVACLMALLIGQVALNVWWLSIGAAVISWVAPDAPLRRHFIYFFLLLSIALVVPPHWVASIRDRLIGVSVGALIGVICHQYLFAVNPYRAFCDNSLPILKALHVDMMSLVAYAMNQQNFSRLTINQETIVVILSHYTSYPEYTYEVGFNPGLRAGYRYFLVHLEQVIELLFALPVLMLKASQQTSVSMLYHVQTVLENNVSLVQTLIERFTVPVIHPDVQTRSEGMLAVNFVDDMQQLENNLALYVPENIALLALSTDDMALVGMVRVLRDLRAGLLTLVACQHV